MCLCHRPGRPTGNLFGVLVSVFTFLCTMPGCTIPRIHCSTVIYIILYLSIQAKVGLYRTCEATKQNHKPRVAITLNLKNKA